VSTSPRGWADRPGLHRPGDDYEVHAHAHTAPAPLLLRTAWRIAGCGDWYGLDVWLTVDTTAPAVVDAIERAAGGVGVKLERR
jgi:hypothetical protein